MASRRPREIGAAGFAYREAPDRLETRKQAIEATLELWRGSTLAASWTSSGTSRVTINESCGVISGQTYTLKAHGTIGGAEFETTPISGQC